MCPTMQLRWRCEEILREDLEIAWEAYKEATKAAMEILPTRMPMPDGTLFVQQEWLKAGAHRERYMRCLKRYSKLVLAKTDDDMLAWAVLMGWQVETRDGVIFKIQELLQKKGPGREMVMRKEQRA